MRRKHRRQEESAEVNVTPLLDIVFIMLIFFIVTASFAREFGIDVDRPSDEPAEVQQEVDVIFVEITATGQIQVDGRTVDIRAVQANVQNLLSANPDAPVVVSSHADAESGLLVRVIDQARRAGAENVSIATN
ncbi:ExbD/TolR family protein [Natronospira bacteriovora]|uniref:Biopolymer transporter ExbD n=1 Tax=Natronospira bacteriovora TaxID=3069753 RepID=A0ABU0W633_9GAMM|nr:biopolymer transporter ExbD [Natronospira sp. AB-CW4]MDQ2069469.1 biopolymer transporter ExbD [Natronospira sp. AB-CW4]